MDRMLYKSKRCSLGLLLFVPKIECYLNRSCHSRKGLFVFCSSLCSSNSGSPYHPIVIIVPNVGKNVGNDTFFHPLLGPVMIGHEHEILIMFLKLKLHVFKDFYSKDA